MSKYYFIYTFKLANFLVTLDLGTFLACTIIAMKAYSLGAPRFLKGERGPKEAPMHRGALVSAPSPSLGAHSARFYFLEPSDWGVGT